MLLVIIQSPTVPSSTEGTLLPSLARPESSSVAKDRSAKL